MATTALYDCIVVGAGAAGLAAAKKLLDCGHKDVIVLEARQRLSLTRIPFFVCQLLLLLSK